MFNETQKAIQVIERGPAIEDEMVREFLRAEIDSSRYGETILSKLARLGIGRSLIDTPDLTHPLENGLRRCLLGYRGYDCREVLFAGFPFDVTWRRVDLEASDFRTMQYIKDTVTRTPNWTKLSNGTRLVSIGARNVLRSQSDPAFQQIVAIAQALRQGVSFPPLIAAQHDQGHPVLIEGHWRATAYAMEGSNGPVGALVGSSPSMNSWLFY